MISYTTTVWSLFQSCQLIGVLFSFLRILSTPFQNNFFHTKVLNDSHSSRFLGRFGKRPGNLDFSFSIPGALMNNSSLKPGEENIGEYSPRGGQQKYLLMISEPETNNK